MAAISLRLAVALAACFLLGILSQSIHTSPPQPALPISQSLVQESLHERNLNKVLENLNKTLAAISILADAPEELPTSAEDVSKPIPVAISVNVGSAELVSEVRSMTEVMKRLLDLSMKVSGGKAVGVPGAAATIAAASTATTAAPLFTPHEVMSFSSGKCIDANYAFKNNSLRIYKCNQALVQSFWETAQQQLRHGSGYCIESSAEADKPALLKYCRANKPAQQWDSVNPQLVNGHVVSYLRNRETNLCLDLENSPDETVIASECSNKCTQMWTVTFSQRNTAVVPAEPLPATSTPENNGPKLFCMVMTYPANHAKAATIAKTWGRSCNTLLFVSTEEVPEQSTFVVDLTQEESKRVIWLKSQHAWMHVYEHYRDQADWFFRADDDTYVVVPYLREFIAGQDSSKLKYYGRRLQVNGQEGDENAYIAGGSGVLLTKAALRLLGESIKNDPTAWAGPINGPSDLLFSRTLHKLGISIGATVDSQHRQRFLPLGLESEHTMTRKKNPNEWLWKYSLDAKEGADCCSPKWISTHYATPAKMETIDMFMRLGCMNRDLNTFPYLEVPH